MLECLVLGDEIALSVAKLNPKCIVAYVDQVDTETYLDRFRTYPTASTTVISLGNHDNKDTIKSLPIIRSKLGNVVWVLPHKSNPYSRDYVLKLALKNKDKITEAPNKSKVEKANTVIENSFKMSKVESSGTVESKINTYELEGVWPIPTSTSESYIEYLQGVWPIPLSSDGSYTESIQGVWPLYIIN